MINFDKENRIFYLHTKSTTYAMGILFEKTLLHLYWGKRLEGNIPEHYIDEFFQRPRVADDYCESQLSTDALPLEYSSFGNPDMRIPSYHAVYSDGTRASRLEFADFEIYDGKKELLGLPSTYSEDGDKVETLVIRLKDKVQNVEVFLSYSVFEEFDAVTRSVKIVNSGEKMRLNAALSATVDFYGMDKSDIIHLDGTNLRERAITRNPIVSGNQNIESRFGNSGHVHSPFIAICDRNATENSGEVFGFNLVYSGNFTAGIEVNAYNCGRAYIGINPFNFEYILEKGDSFQTPEAVLVFSSEGLGGMSRIYHKLYRTRLCRGKYRDRERFVLVNNWEATYFDFNEEKILKIAEKAATLGIDTMVLDDGWFGKRLDDRAGLGDWFENKDRLPNGLKGLAEKVNNLGMRFGLWFEPEMVNPDSDLFRTHPEWVLQIKGRENYYTRHQLVLDLSRDDVCDFVIDCVSNILSNANIEYVKWDMNRNMSEIGSLALDGEHQGEVAHRYVLGLYRVLETITSRFSNVLFESCAGGGGRFDGGMLYYMPQTWTSDDSDAVERLDIQYGTSIVYPFSAMGAHVSAVPNHQVKRITPIEMRCNVAMPGQFGFELDLNKCTDEELETVKRSIEQYRELQLVFHNGDCYRLRSPFETGLSAIEFISEDKNTVVLCINSRKPIPYGPDEYIRLEGLDVKANYDLSGKIYSGSYLLNKGYHFINEFEYTSEVLVFKKI